MLSSRPPGVAPGCEVEPGAALAYAARQAYKKDTHSAVREIVSELIRSKPAGGGVRTRSREGSKERMGRRLDGATGTKVHIYSRLSRASGQERTRDV